MNWVRTLELVEQHFHSAQKVAPSGVAAVTLTSGGGAWNLGDFSADIIAADAEPLEFDLHWVSISAPDANAQYEIVFYYGATDIEACRVSFARTNVFTSSILQHIQTAILPAGSRIRAKMMDSAGGSACKVKVHYHSYH